MAVYSVLEPPPRPDGRAAPPDRFAFVRDGFSWPAFLFGPLWMLWRRLWLGLLGYVLLLAALETTYRLLGVPVASRVLIGAVVALLIGLEAASLRRWTMIRRGWRDHGIVIGDDRESVERRFFGDWANGASSPQGVGTVATGTSAVPRRASPATSVVGLFPQPGGGR